LRDSRLNAFNSEPMCSERNIPWTFRQGSVEDFVEMELFVVIEKEEFLTASGASEVHSFSR
jgi:hypothetical protein